MIHGDRNLTIADIKHRESCGIIALHGCTDQATTIGNPTSDNRSDTRLISSSNNTKALSLSRSTCSVAESIDSIITAITAERRFSRRTSCAPDRFPVLAGPKFRNPGISQKRARTHSVPNPQLTFINPLCATLNASSAL